MRERDDDVVAKVFVRGYIGFALHTCIYMMGQILGKKKTRLCPVDGAIALCILVPYLTTRP